MIDSHCHLDFPDFANEIDAVVARARTAGLERMITISTRVREFDRITALVDRFEDVYGSVGTHCHNAAYEDDISAEEIVAKSRHPKIVAIGEAGLDYHYELSPRDVQARGFRRHIAVARETGLPLVVHARDADDDMAAILSDEMESGPFTAVLHCFSSGADLARRGIELGLYISFSGILTFKKSDALREIAATVPVDRLLVETDAPYLAPMPFRGKRNEPAYVVNTAQVLADLLGMDREVLARTTTENCYRLFTKLPRPSADGFAA